MRRSSASAGFPTVRASRSLLLVLVALVSVGGSAAPAGAQEFEAELDAVAERLEAAREAGLALIAPRYFERATRRLREARTRYGGGEEIARVRRTLEEARDALAAAERLRDAGREIFAGALEAREAALEARAPERAPASWGAAEEAAREAGRELEEGAREEAGDRASRAAGLYRRAELEAIRADVLGPAARLRAVALETEADERAPVTFRAAEAALDSADRVLAGDRTRLTTAGELGERAADRFRRAARIAGVADSVDEELLSVEDLLRRYEGEFARIAGPLGFEPDLEAGTDSVADQLLAAIRSLREDRANLRKQLSETEADVAALRERADSLETHLAGAEAREAEIAARLRERERRERRMREVRAVFSPEEGEVVTRGDSLVVRLYGLTFESGSDEIRPEDFSLLTKLQRVLREFPEAPVTIQGHTDSRGNDEFNRVLSQRRAISIREHLLASMAVSASRISAVGYGEARPIASNDTEEGREKNRRIEVVVDLSEGAPAGEP